MPYWPANERHKFLQTKQDAPHPALPQQALPGAASARAQLDAEVGLKQESAHAAFGSCVEGLGMVRGLPHWSQEMPQTGMRPAIPLQVLASALATRLLARSFSPPPPLLLSPLCPFPLCLPPLPSPWSGAPSRAQTSDNNCRRIRRNTMIHGCRRPR